MNNLNPADCYSTMDSSSNTMETASLYSSDLSGMSNDTFEITRRGRQDVLTMDGRLPVDRRYQRRGATDFSFPAPTDSRWSNATSKRRVSFAGTKVINEGADEVITEEEMQIRWWSQDDLEMIKKCAKEMSLKLRKLAKERGCYVETAHKKTSLMLTNSFQELVKMTPSSPDQDLRHWCARSDGRRGLERFACRDFGNSRKEDVLGTRKAVFDEQDRQRRKQTYNPDNIAKVCKAHSRRSRTFSLFMGEADAQSANDLSSAASTSSRSRTSVQRTSSKRVQASRSPSRQQPKQKQQRRVAGTSRGFPVEAPVLTSSA